MLLFPDSGIFSLDKGRSYRSYVALGYPHASLLEKCSG
jgi:hypothetical protein